MSNQKDPLKENKQEFNSSLDKDFDVSKTWLGILLTCVLLIFAPIVGVVKYPKGTKARKTYMRASIITLIVIVILATSIGLLCYFFIFVISTVAQGTVEGIVDGVIDGATKSCLTLFKNSLI